MQYLVDQDGKYTGTLTGTPEEILLQVPAGHIAVHLPPPRSTDYWNGTEWVSIGTRPTENHKYNYASKRWEDVRPLYLAKEQRWNDIKRQRNLIEISGFMFEGRKFDSDHISQTRILAAAVMGQPVTWTLADDSTMDLLAEELPLLGGALANHVTSTHARGRLARQLIDQALTNEEVDAVIL